MAVTTISGFLDPPVDGFTDIDPAGNFDTTEATLATLNLTIPAHWGGCKVYATAIVGFNGTAGDRVQIRVRIDGTDGTTQDGRAEGVTTTISAAGRKTGITTTGTLAVLVRGTALSLQVDTSIERIHLYAIAQRTA